jgi:molecular chaperone GrpE
MVDENGNGAAPEADEDETAPEEIEALRAEVAAMKDRALRALADAENTRKRAEREREETKTFAITRFARDLLSVSDNLSRALAALPPDAKAAAADSVKAILDGVEATERELQAVLARHGVKSIEAEGAKFDPNLHQAIAEVPGEGRAPGTVVSVVQGGYTIGERLLRPAMVTIAQAP